MSTSKLVSYAVWFNAVGAEAQRLEQGLEALWADISRVWRVQPRDFHLVHRAHRLS